MAAQFIKIGIRTWSFLQADTRFTRNLFAIFFSRWVKV